MHELRSLFCPIGLSDELDVSEAERDEVVCPEVPAPDLASRALGALRDRGWNGPPLRIEVRKRIPVAAGLGGGSADAGAVLRLASGEVDGLEGVASELGADVPSQLQPAFALVGGAGEEVEPLPGPPQFGAVLVPDPEGLPTAEVYAEADRLGLGRDATELKVVGDRLREAARAGGTPLEYRELLVNDLEPATLSLRPSVADALAALREAGAGVALVTGSGPTAFGLFDDPEAAAAASERIRKRRPAAIATSSAVSP